MLDSIAPCEPFGRVYISCIYRLLKAQHELGKSLHRMINLRYMEELTKFGTNLRDSIILTSHWH